MFRFHGNAVGAAGRIVAPYDETIPALATAALPEIGGVARAKAGKFDFRGIFRFEAARAELIGRYDEQDRAWETMISATVEGLNIMEMVTADRVVARLVSIHKRDEPEPSITPVGSHFENLRIAGCRVVPDLATDVFHKYSTFSSLGAAYRQDPENGRAQFSRVGSPGNWGQASKRARLYLPDASFADQLQTAEVPSQSKEQPGSQKRSIYSTSLVRRVGGVRPRAMVVSGHVIEIEGFGMIRLAEFHIAKYWKRLTMLQVNLGSPARGDLLYAAAEGNGSDW